MTSRPKVFLPSDRYFDPDPRQKEIAQRLYECVAQSPLVCPHGHVDPAHVCGSELHFRYPDRAIADSRSLRLQDALFPRDPARTPGYLAQRRQQRWCGSPPDLADLRGAFLPLPQHPHRNMADSRAATMSSESRTSLPVSQLRRSMITSLPGLNFPSSARVVCSTGSILRF